MLEVRLLGDPLIVNDGVRTAFRAPDKALSLLGYLTLHRGELSRSRVAFDLWPDIPEKAARGNLRRHLYLLQATLPNDAVWLRGGRQTIAWFGGDDSWIDALAFDALSASPETISAAAALYRGELLTGMDDEWINPLRTRYRERQTENLFFLVRRCRAHGQLDAATDYGAQLLRLDPFREDAVRQLMEVRFAAADRAGALRLYVDLKERLADELKTEPSAETRDLASWIEGQSGLLAVAGGSVRRGMPPLPATSFHGRENDIERVRNLLASSRVVTLIGPGGVGKTRLAVEAAARVAAEFEDGARLIDFSGVDDGAVLAEHLLQVLGIYQPPGVTAVVTAMAELREREILLVFDNCEQVLTHAARLVQRLVRDAPRLRTLVTSREPLGAAGKRCILFAPSRQHRNKRRLGKKRCERLRCSSSSIARWPATEPAILPPMPWASRKFAGGSTAYR